MSVQNGGSGHHVTNCVKAKAVAQGNPLCNGNTTNWSELSPKQKVIMNGNPNGEITDQREKTRGFKINGAGAHGAVTNGNGVQNGVQNGVGHTDRMRQSNGASNVQSNGRHIMGSSQNNGTTTTTKAALKNGHGSSGIPCCQSQEEYDNRFLEGYEFLNQAVDILLDEAKKQGMDKDRKIVEFLHPASMETQIDFRLEGDPVTNSDLIATCHDIIKFSVKTGHPHFFNQLFGGIDPYGLTGAWMTDVLNTSQYTYEVAPVFTMMERALFGEMRRLVGFNGGDGIFCPGGSISNMYAINLARFKSFPDVKQKGLWHLPRMCIMTSEKGHYSLKKGAALLGFGMDNVFTVKTDDKGRMIPHELDNALTAAKKKGIIPIMVNATAGSTVLGAYDPLGPIAKVCQIHGVWMHVDACWGGGVLLSDTLRHKMDGVERADSVSWNPHKMMGAPLQAAVFLTRHETLLSECHSAKAQYLFQQDKFYDVSYDTGDKSIQCGRKVDVLKVWLMWKAKGTRGFAANIDHLFHCSQYLTQKLATRDGFRLVLSEPECTNVCFWYIPRRLQGQEETKEWWQEIGKVAPQIKERMVMKGTILTGYQPEGDLVNFFRLVISNMAVKLEDMDFVIDEIERLGHDL